MGEFAGDAAFFGEGEESLGGPGVGFSVDERFEAVEAREEGGVLELAVHGVVLHLEGHSDEFGAVWVELEVGFAGGDVGFVVPEEALLEEVFKGFEVCGPDGFFSLLAFAARMVGF